AHTQKLRDVIKLAGGQFDEQLGKVEITLKSGFAASEFYDAITKAKGVLELSVELSWVKQYTDFVRLKDMVSRSNIRSIKVNLTNTTDRRIDVSLLGRKRYDPLVEIMRLASIQSFEVSSVFSNFFKNIQLVPKNASVLANLRHLGICGNLQALVDADMVKLQLLISLAPNLSSLSLEKNMKWSLALSAALKTDTTLTTLNLQNNSIESNGVQALSEALKTNSTLTTLNLERNSIGDSGAQVLSEALKTNSTLTTLNLGGNSIWFKGFFALSEALKSNPTLTSLELRGNKIGDKAAQALSEARKANSTLTTLNLEYNSIGDNGAQAL
ncbi:hypothetical protein BGX26_008085, partial [Mortierella sp. AD094]